MPRIKGLCHYLIIPSSAKRRALPPQNAGPIAPDLTPIFANRILNNNRIDLVVIGVSTGGPNALAEIIPAPPKELPVPILIVQHMPTMFTKLFTERLDSKSALAVNEASTSGIIAKPGQVWLAPGGHHLCVKRSGFDFALSINEDALDQSCRPSVNVLFRSAAAACGTHTLAIILTGMGEDGLEGCKAIREAGGHVVAQDKESSIVWGMPGSVAKAGHAEKVIPLSHIAAENSTRVRHERPTFHGLLREVTK